MLCCPFSNNAKTTLYSKTIYFVDFRLFSCKFVALVSICVSGDLVLTEKGKFLALDLGGTNNRMLLMTCSGNPEVPPRKIEKFYQIPSDKMTGTSKSVS